MGELEILLHAVQEAGEAILAIQKTGFSIEKKTNNDIVTQADLLANEILKKQLMSAFPKDGWLSEESIDGDNRLHCARVWVVDPIDGTKEYANKIPEYAISVALVEKNQPTLAAVFNPATNELFYAVAGKGAWLGQEKINCHSVTKNDQVLLLASRSEYQRGEWSRFERRHTVKPMGSIAYKLGLLAAGRAQATFSLGPKHEWDIAAGVLLVKEAQGLVTNKNKADILFNQKDCKVNGIIATTRAQQDHIFSLIASSN